MGTTTGLSAFNRENFFGIDYTEVLDTKNMNLPENISWISFVTYTDIKNVNTINLLDFK